MTTKATPPDPRIRLHEVQPCAGCGRHPLDANALTFYRVTIRQAVMDPAAARSSYGLAMQLGGSMALADVFAPHNGEVVLPRAMERTVDVCIDCLAGKTIAEIEEAAAARDA